MELTKLATRALRRDLGGFRVLADPDTASAEDVLRAAGKLVRDGNYSGALFIAKATEPDQPESDAQLEERERLALMFAAEATTPKAVEVEQINGKAIDATAAAIVASMVQPPPSRGDSKVTPAELFGAGAERRQKSKVYGNPPFNSPDEGQKDTTMIRVKEPSEKFIGDRLVGKHVRTGEIVLDQKGRPVCLPAESDYAKIGAFVKQRAFRAGLGNDFPQNERDLLAEMVERDAWVGQIGNEWGRHTGARVKALLGDSGGASGGVNLIPAVFDDAAITFPLLHSELLPYVDLRDVPKGSSIEGASIQNPTLAWGTSEGTALTVFNTASMVAAVNTSIFAVVCGVEMGREFLSDAAVDVGKTVAQLIGERLKEELDDVICNGNGADRPLGLFNSSGTSIIVQQSPSPTGWDVKDVEALLFGIGKQYRANKGPSVRWVMNDTTYRRIRSLAISSSDQRRLFGMTHEDYVLFGRPVSIQNDISNRDVAFVDLSKYRLYRRLGGELRFSDQGQTLMLKNTALITFRGRYGGRLTDGAAMAEFNTAPQSE
ncbi:MAG: phage major capsid protein [Pirellulales bacterium]